MNIDTERGLARLREVLPIEARQLKLDAELREVHRAILRSFVERGSPLEHSGIEEMLSGRTVNESLAVLDDNDLIVWDRQMGGIVGAYPFAMKDTPHTIERLGCRMRAMCAVDALSVSPMFGGEVRISSSCYATGTPIHLYQRDRTILGAEPSLDVHVGVRWQGACGCAADTICTEMVFLRDREIAVEWRGRDVESKSLYTLAEAVELSAEYFTPLIRKKAVVPAS